jgi:hypothetical protein
MHRSCTRRYARHERTSSAWTEPSFCICRTCIHPYENQTSATLILRGCKCTHTSENQSRGISLDHSISNVFLVDSLDYNLLSVSQLCKMGYNCLFTDIGVTVFRRSDDSVAFKGVLEGQLYLVDFNRAEFDTCLISKTNMGWL